MNFSNNFYCCDFLELRRLVIDNAPIHSGLEEIIQEPEFTGNHILG